MRHPYPFRLLAIASASALLLTACGGDDDPLPVAEETRPQDSRTAFAPADPTATTFAAMANGTAETDGTSRWAGVLNGAAYRVEVPANWNGKLVMYAHGYAGTGNALGVNNPSIRRHLLMNGYAWAASSYSKNYYDVRVGVEDTNALALAFTQIATANSRPLTAPTKLYIIGHSMGGHITGAAIDSDACRLAALLAPDATYAGAGPISQSLQIAKAAGITKRIGPHSLRHSFITAALDADAQGQVGISAAAKGKLVHQHFDTVARKYEAQNVGQA